jgi:hypothetical protein
MRNAFQKNDLDYIMLSIIMFNNSFIRENNMLQMSFRSSENSTLHLRRTVFSNQIGKHVRCLFEISIINRLFL